MIPHEVFTTGLESILLKTKGRLIDTNINGEYLNHLWLVDDILSISESLDNLQEMLNDLNREMLNVGKKNTFF